MIKKKKKKRLEPKVKTQYALEELASDPDLCICNWMLEKKCVNNEEEINSRKFIDSGWNLSCFGKTQVVFFFFTLTKFSLGV